MGYADRYRNEDRKLFNGIRPGDIVQEKSIVGDLLPGDFEVAYVEADRVILRDAETGKTESISFSVACVVKERAEDRKLRPNPTRIDLLLGNGWCRNDHTGRLGVGIGDVWLSDKEILTMDQRMFDGIAEVGLMMSKQTT